MQDRHGEFLKLFLKHNSALYAYIIARGIRPDHADDVLQNVASVLWGKFDDFQPGTNFNAWAFSVAKIEIMRTLDDEQRDSRKIRLDPETLKDLESLEIRRHGGVLDDRKHLLVSCLKKLGDAAAQLIRMRYGDELPMNEIARRLNLSGLAARIKVCRIRKLLRDCVAANLGGSGA